MKQMAGVQAALEQVSLLLLENHLWHCASDVFQQEKCEEKIREIMDVIHHSMKTEMFHLDSEKG